MNDDRDPLIILATTNDPKEAARMVSVLKAAGFTDVERIARDFGWQIEEPK